MREGRQRPRCLLLRVRVGALLEVQPRLGLDVIAVTLRRPVRLLVRHRVRALLDQLRLWDKDEISLRALLLWGAAQADTPPPAREPSAAPAKLVLGLKRKSDEAS